MVRVTAPRDTHPPAQLARVVFGGVDTHRDTHTAAALDEVGRVLRTASFATDRAGYAALLAWLSGFGDLAAVGVEGTGSYGAGLARYLSAHGVCVVEVDRPDRQARRHDGKSDPVDAVAAARAVLAGRATGTPKSRDGQVEALRVLHGVRDQAVKARTAAMNHLHQLVVTAPDNLRQHLRTLPSTTLVATCARLRPGPDLSDPQAATKHALRRLAQRIQHLSCEIGDADRELDALLAHLAPRLIAAFGVGRSVAAQLLITAGDNPTRITSEASFAALCGVSPISASSGRTTRHRLNRGGDRAANCALYRVALVRMQRHQPTIDYVERRALDHKTKKDTLRCLKRYLVRELLPLIRASLADPANDETTTSAAA